jgi:hypothetical protein
LCEALHDLRARGLVLDSFNCLALQRVFAGRTIMTPDQQPVGIEVFAETARTFGPLVDCLRERIDSGAQSLKEALGHWLIPRHTAQLQDAVDGGKILLRIRLADGADERRALSDAFVPQLQLGWRA